MADIRPEEQRLLLKLIRVGSRKVALLCDDAEIPLPNQESVVLEQLSPNETSTVTVRFTIDNNKIRLD